MSNQTRAASAAAEKLYRAAAADSLKDLAEAASRALEAHHIEFPWDNRTVQQDGQALALHVAYDALRDARKRLAAAHDPFGKISGDTP